MGDDLTGLVRFGVVGVGLLFLGLALAITILLFETFDVFKRASNLRGDAKVDEPAT